MLPACWFRVAHLQPNLDRVWDLLDSLGQDSLGILGSLQPRRLEPHVLIGGARHASLTDDLASVDQLASYFLEAGCSDPARTVTGIGGRD
jgi:hypothetical protein